MTEDLDAFSAERLLADPAAVSDAADAAPKLSALLRDAAADAPASEPSPALLTAMAAEARAAHDLSPAAGKARPALGRVLTAKVVAVTAAVALTATGAAAATGSLPDAAQDGIAGAAEHIGLNLPDSADDRAREVTEDAPPADPGPAGEQPGDAEQLEGSEAHDGHGAGVSSVATDPALSGADRGDAVSDAATDNHGRTVAGERGGEGDAPAATPNRGEAGTPGGNPAAEAAPVETPTRDPAAEHVPPAASGGETPAGESQAPAAPPAGTPGSEPADAGRANAGGP